MPKELLFIRTDKEQIPDEHLNAFSEMSSQVGVNVTLKDISSVSYTHLTLPTNREV